MAIAEKAQSAVTSREEGALLSSQGDQLSMAFRTSSQGIGVSELCATWLSSGRYASSFSHVDDGETTEQLTWRKTLMLVSRKWQPGADQGLGTTYLGADEFNIVNESHAVAVDTKFMCDAEMRITTVLRAKIRGLAEAEEEVKGVFLQVLLKLAVLKIGKVKTEVSALSTRVRARVAGVQLLQVTYDDGPGEEVLCGETVVGVCGQAELAVVLEPYNVKVAAIVLELLEEALDGVDCMQDLEAV